MRGELRRGVELQGREVPAAYARDAEVLYDQRVGSDPVEFRQLADRALHVPFVDERVEGDVDLLPVAARDPDELAETVGREVLCEGPGGEGAEAAIYRIGARVKRRERRVEITCRC